ncbi:MAG: HAD hydrolase-like protein [Alphaproteobacteria bacterium]|nr:HAD hydrolase-like protein [Alphaproteobacteria bacterium]
MSLQRPTIVLFDMDGTAVRHINPRLLHVLEVLDTISYRCAKLFSWIFKRGGKGPIIPRWHKRRKQPRLLVHRAIHKFRRKPVEQIVEPCPGLYDLLEYLEEKNIPTALVSNGLGKGYGYDILKKFDLEKHFKATVFREDIPSAKPSPDSLLLALEQMNVTITKDDIIWYIGDRRKDVIAALAATKQIAGKVVPIAFGVNAAIAVIEKNIGPDNIIMSFHDMYDQIRQMFEETAQEIPLPAKKEPETEKIRSLL